MQIVINIPEPPFYRDIYTAICENGYIYDEDNEYIAKAIKNGTLLPKGHGKIIDSKEVYKFSREKFPCMNSDDIMCRGAVATVLRYATAITEANEVEK